MPVEIPTLDFAPIMPVVAVVVTALVVMILDMIFEDTDILVYASVAGLVGALMPSIVLLGGTADAPMFQTTFIGDGYAAVMHIIFIITAILSILISIPYLKERGMYAGEYFVLLLLATSGMMLMAGAADLIVVFMGLEIMSIALYVMAGFNRKKLSSSEAGIKYFLLGAFASAFFLYGAALVYGATGTTNLAGIGEWFAFHTVSQEGLLGSIGLAFLLIGFAFKVSAVPFQWWTPDVYYGAPTSVTAFMSVGAKAAGFAALVRVIAVSFGEVFVEEWAWVIGVLAVVTMTVGNIAALNQKDVKRMLAYSSIAHAGYILVGVVALSPETAQIAASGILFYLLSYALINIGAFAVVAVLEHREGIGSALEDYTGLSKRQPMLALAMLLFMFALTGIPPFVGFWGKWYVFWAAVDAGYWQLAAIAMLNSAISAFYYLGVVIQMYLKEVPEGDEETADSPVISLPFPTSFVIGVTSVAAILFGVWPTLLFNLTSLGLLG